MSGGVGGAGLTPAPTRLSLLPPEPAVLTQFTVAAPVLYLGLIWVAFEPRKRGWHDMMADTVVICIN